MVLFFPVLLVFVIGGAVVAHRRIQEADRAHRWPAPTPQGRWHAATGAERAALIVMVVSAVVWTVFVVTAPAALAMAAAFWAVWRHPDLERPLGLVTIGYGVAVMVATLPFGGSTGAGSVLFNAALVGLPALASGVMLVLAAHTTEGARRPPPARPLSGAHPA